MHILFVISSVSLRLRGVGLWVVRLIIMVFRVNILWVGWCVGERIVAMEMFVGRCIISMSCAYSRIVATSCNIARVDGGAIWHFTA